MKLSRGWSFLLLLAYNAFSGAAAFQLVRDGSPASKWCAFAAWLISNTGLIMGQPVASKAKAPPVAALLPFLAVLGLSGCTTAYTATAASLISAERIVGAAAEQFPAFDQAKRAAIVAQATSRDAGIGALTEWDGTSDKVVKAINGAHATVKLGADGLKGVREGLRDPKQLGSWIQPAIRVGLDLVNLLAAVGLKLQGVR